MKRDVQNELEQMEAYLLLAFKQKKQESYVVPAGYFEQKKQALKQVSSAPSINYQVPDNYFEQLNQSVMDRIDSLEAQENSKEKLTHTRSSKQLRLFSPIFSVAAAVLLLTGVFFFISNSTNGNQDTLAIEEAFNEEELAFLNAEAETYVFDALYDDFGAPEEEEDQLLDPLFEDEIISFDTLFSI